MTKKTAANGTQPDGDSPQSNQLLTQLATRLSAAIGAPAQSIVSLSDDVLDTALSTVQREQVRLIRGAAEGLLKVVADLADYSSLGGGSLTLSKSPFSLRDLMAETSSGRLHVAQEKNLLLRVEIDGDVPDALVGDAGRLGQALCHVLDAVIAYSEAGEVLLRSEPEFITQSEATLAFAISGSGAGLPGQMNASDKGETAGQDATGLNLDFARRLIEAMGGELQATKRPGGASMLGFSAAFGIVAEIKMKPVAQRFNSLAALPVLIVADDPDEREELAKLFNDWHMRPQEADSGEMAIALLERGIETGQPIPLVIFTDRVHGQDGFMLALRIKRHQQVNATSLIMLTGQGRRGDAIKCRENGVTGYLLKPVNPHDLREAVNTLLGVRVEDYAATLVTRHSLREQRQGAAILLVEDDRDSQLLAAHFLDRNRFSVVLAGSGAEALRMTEQQRFDLILLDMELKGLDGIAVARKIRAAEKNAGAVVPIVAITAGASAERERRYKAAGITDVLVKPLQRDVLLAMVFRYVQVAV